MRPLIRTAALALGGVTMPAVAHGRHAPHDAPGWTTDPWIVVPLILSAALFGLGWHRLRLRSTQGRAAFGRRLALFAAGWGTLATALVSPLHEAGERSFAAHMVEHELLMLVAAPLLVLSAPLAVLLWAFPAGGRRAIGAVGRSRPIAALWSRLTEPVTATLVQAAALWGWHAPGPFDRALADEGWHALQHISFLASALLFWTAMLGRGSARGVSALCLFATSLVSGALGALMAFAASPWYPAYARLGMTPFGLTAAEDQQLAGLIMWIPGGLVHAGAALAMMAALIRSPAREEVSSDAV